MKNIILSMVFILFYNQCSPIKQIEIKSIYLKDSIVSVKKLHPSVLAQRINWRIEHGIYEDSLFYAKNQMLSSKKEIRQWRKSVFTMLKKQYSMYEIRNYSNLVIVHQNTGEGCYGQPNYIENGNLEMTATFGCFGDDYFMGDHVMLIAPDCMKQVTDVIIFHHKNTLNSDTCYIQTRNDEGYMVLHRYGKKIYAPDTNKVANLFHQLMQIRNNIQ